MSRLGEEELTCHSMLASQRARERQWRPLFPEHYGIVMIRAIQICRPSSWFSRQGGRAKYLFILSCERKQ
jgi:hypothetical protein